MGYTLGCWEVGGGFDDSFRGVGLFSGSLCTTPFCSGIVVPFDPVSPRDGSYSRVIFPPGLPWVIDSSDINLSSSPLAGMTDPCATLLSVAGL